MRIGHPPIPTQFRLYLYCVSCPPESSPVSDTPLAERHARYDTFWRRFPSLLDHDQPFIYGTGDLGQSLRDVLCFIEPSIERRLRFVDSTRSGIIGTIAVHKVSDLSAGDLKLGAFLLASTWEDELAANLPANADKVYCAEACSGAVSSFRLLEEACGKLQGMKILDFGSGSGLFVALCRARSIECFGCDIQPPNEPFLTQLRDIIRTPVEAGRGNFNIDYVAMPFADKTFDVVLTCHVMEHLARFEAAWSDLARVTRPGGSHVHRVPGRLLLREIHTNVLAGGLCSSRWFIELGRRIDRLRGIDPGPSSSETTAAYLKNCVFYGNNPKLLAKLRQAFSTVRLQSESRALRHDWQMHFLSDTRLIATGYRAA